MSDNSKKYTPTEKERKLVEWVYSKFKQAYVAKAPLMDKWKEYMSAYKGTYFQNKNLPDYKSNEISNHVFSTIETIRPIMTDNNPKFLAVPNTPMQVWSFLLMCKLHLITNGIGRKCL